MRIDEAEKLLSEGGEKLTADQLEERIAEQTAKRRPSVLLELFPNLFKSLPKNRDGFTAPIEKGAVKAAKKAFAADLKAARTADSERKGAAKASAKAERKRSKSIAAQLKERDKELQDRTVDQRERRRKAKDVYGAIGFERVFRSGMAEVEEGLFSETVEFDDISYQSARDNAQATIFESMAQLHDYFDADSTFQYTITNTPLLEDEIGNRKFFDPAACGENAHLAEQYNAVLNAKVREGSSNIVRHRYLTYATHAENADKAARTLRQTRNRVYESFEAVRSHARVLDGEQRLKLISWFTRPGQHFDFEYDRDISIYSPLTTKDYVCPMALDFRPAGSDSTCYRADGMWCQALVIRENLASDLDDRCISKIMDLQMPLAVTWTLQPIEKSKSIMMVKRQAAWVQKDVIDAQRKAIRDGYDYQILPTDIADTKSENEWLLDNLTHANQHYFYFSGVVWTYAPTRDELDNQVMQIVSTARAAGIELGVLDLRQREGMNSVLPLAHNHVNVVRDLTTTQATIFMPFTTQELDMAGGGYYGQNKHSGNLVICRRKDLMSPHGFVSGMSGSGKSFSCKREIANTLLSDPDPEVYIFDRTGEYTPITAGLHGVEFNFGPDATSFLNPFDMELSGDMSWHSALAWKTDIMTAMIASLKSEGAESLTQTEKSIINRCIQNIYSQGADGPVPTLADFQAELERYEGTNMSEARSLALIFERFTTGPMSFLNHHTNVRFGENRLVSFNTKDVPEDMQVFTTLSNLESVRQRMLANHKRGVETWVYIDEIQSLFGHPAILEYMGRLWREGRKFGLVATGMTQSVEAMANSEEAAAIVDNSGFLYLLRQQSLRDREFWVKAKDLSKQEYDAIGDSCKRGEGLLIADAARVAFTDNFPSDNDLYTIFSTSPEDYARQQEALAQNS